jgi:DNA-binding NarL/FixJ family response regulator
MIQAFQELFERLGFKRARRRRSFVLNEHLHDAVLERAGIERREVDDLVAELVSTGLRRIENEDWLSVNWERLSHREQQITALTCLGYTNKQIASRLGIMEETVKTHVKNVLGKFNLHRKTELEKAFSNWNFSKWDK